MKIKVEKYIYLKTADIIVYKIDCNAEDIVKLIEILGLDNVVTVISPIKKGSLLFNKIETLGMKCKAFSIKKSSDLDVVLLSQAKELKELLNDVFESDVEIISVIATDDTNVWTEYSSITKYSGRDLLRDRLSDVFFTAITDEHMISITLNKAVYDAKQIAAKIKALF